MINERKKNFKKYFGDIIPKDRIEAIAEDPGSIGACNEEAYLNMHIERARRRAPRNVDDMILDGETLNRVLDEVREEMRLGY